MRTYSLNKSKRQKTKATRKNHKLGNTKFSITEELLDI